jgi:hypothetical protein
MNSGTTTTAASFRRRSQRGSGWEFQTITMGIVADVAGRREEGRGGRVVSGCGTRGSVLANSQVRLPRHAVPF